VEKVYIIARLYTPFYKAFKENKFYHTGSPAYYNFIKFIDNKTDIDYEIIFLGDKTNSLLFQNKSYKLENLNKPIKFIPYKNIFSNNKFVKIEIILNKLYQYFYLIKTLKSNCIYYIDRENIPLGLFLKFKKGLICYRVLGITQKVYNILFKRNDLVNYIFKKSLNLKNAIIISSNDGSWAEKTKKEIEKRYLEILKKANNIEDILKVERVLGDLRVEIERIEGDFKYLSSKISFSTLSIVVYESIKHKAVKSSTDSGNKYIRYFKRAFKDGFESLMLFFVFLANIWPIILITILIIILLKRKKRLKKKKNDSIIPPSTKGEESKNNTNTPKTDKELL